MSRFILSTMKGCIAAILLCLTQISWAGSNSELLKADIYWTAYGIPHIKAKNEYGLGYGIGYVYARDNACLLVDEAITARGERSRYFGAQAESSAQLNNLTSDIFFTWLNTDSNVNEFWNAQPKPIQQLLLGYAEGFNRFLDEADKQSMSCLGEAWLNPITHEDLVRLTRRLLVEGGIGQFAESMVGAEPPQGWLERLIGKVVTTVAEDTDRQATLEPWNGQLKFGMGSNAVAVGGKRSVNGGGMLLANPHFPWQGALRFYQMHLTIPGQLDVMGAALPGLPLINIGFNQHMAWTHTVDTSSHFTLYRLELDPDDATRYLVDGQSHPLIKKLLQVQVRNDEGELSTHTHQMYESKFGPLVIWPGMLEWSEKEAFALRDANLSNTRVLQQWYEINHAGGALDVRDSIEKTQGIPWVNTLATDDKGHALYMNQSVVPHLLAKQLADCSIPELVKQGLPALEGQRSDCDWHIDQAAAQAGITPSNQLPTLLRSDFVQNSNDSAWLTNPDSPIEGYSPLVSREGGELGLRARFALSRLQGDELLTEGFLKKMVTDNQVYLVGLVLDDLFAFCTQQKGDEALDHACTSLKHWDGRANIESGLGFVYFNFFMHYFNELEGGWRIPFDPQNPLKTPRGIALDNASVVESIRQALIEAEAKIKEWGIPDTARWGDIQVTTRGNKRIGIPGGEGDLGIYNVIENQLREGLLEVVSGSSYIQLVTFNNEGPQARGLIAFSQSSEPASPHYSDQTQLFSRQHWPVLPYTEEQIKADPAIEHMELLLH